MRWFILVLVASLGIASSANALPPIPSYVKESLEDKPEYKTYLDQLAAAKDKCASCHQPGVDKAKVKGHGLNDFGKVVHDNLDHKAFMAAHKAKERAQALKLFNDAWAKSLEAKNADGQAYGELIKSGKLPGKNE